MPLENFLGECTVIKQTKMVKFVFILLLIIPAFLLCTAFIQTFILKSRQSELNILQSNLSNLKQEEQVLEEIEGYKSSQDYIDDYNKHNGKTNGETGDIKIETE